MEEFDSLVGQQESVARVNLLVAGSSALTLIVAGCGAWDARLYSSEEMLVALRVTQTGVFLIVLGVWLLC